MRAFFFALILFVAAPALAADVTLTWTDPNAEASRVEYWVIQWRVQDGAWSSDQEGTSPGPIPRFITPNVLAGGAYEWRVKAVNAAGESVWAEFAALILNPPVGPQDIKIESVTFTLTVEGE